MFPAAGWQHTLMKKDFTPEGMLFGHNTLYFDNPNASPLAKEFVAWYEEKHKDYPEWEADRAYFAIASYKAAVEEARRPRAAAWPSQDDVIGAMVGLSVESLGGKGSWRKDHIADQTFVQGFTTHNNKYDFVTLGTLRDHVLGRPAEAAGRQFLGVAEDRAVQDLMPANRIECRRSPTFCSAAFFMPPSFSGRRRAAARVRRAEDRQSRLRLVLRAGRLFRHHLRQLCDPAGMPAWLLLPGLIVAGIVLGVIGPPIERMLRTVYDRDESFQLLLTFALVLMFQDVFRFVWGANPRSLDNV